MRPRPFLCFFPALCGVQRSEAVGDDRYLFAKLGDYSVGAEGIPLLRSLQGFLLPVDGVEVLHQVVGDGHMLDDLRDVAISS